MRLVNTFMNAFEDNVSLIGKFTETTQKYVKTSSQATKKETKNPSSIFNITIEAPVFLVPNKSCLWVADLGKFKISKSNNSNLN